jgi:tetratricopeptide (TPR) repeat protein
MNRNAKTYSKTGVASLALLTALVPSASWAQQAASTAPPVSLFAAPSAARAAPSLAAAPVAPTNTALSVLLQQAAYWRDQNNPPRALQAVQRALLLSPNNPRALAILAELQASSGDTTAAQQTLQLLQKTSPTAPDIHQAQQAVRVGEINPDALANARQLAQQGHVNEAATAYRQIFGGSTTPPDSLAVEYYQTLSGTSGGYQSGLDGLAATAEHDPNNLRAQIAYAQALTYRADTRNQGIDRLSVLSQNPSIGAQARESWREALGWLPADKSSVSAINAYKADYPDDPGVGPLLANALKPPNLPPGVQEQSAGFEALQQNNLTQAQTLFQQALTINPKDASATGGLGLVMLRQGRSAEATTLFNRAIALDPSQAPQWRAALNGAKQAAAGAALGGEFRTAAAASTSGDLPRAETLYRSLLARQPGNTGIKMALAGVLAREGNQAEAQTLLADVEQSGNGALSQQARAQLLSDQAKGMPDAAGQIALYRSAVDADPTSPWLRLDLARALVKNGQLADAQSTMSEVTDVARPSSAAVQAGIIFANETGDSAGAAALIGKVPPRQRTADMRAIIAAAQVQGQINNATAFASSDPASTRQQLFAIAAQRDPTGGRGLAVAQAFVKLSDPTDARTAIATAAAANPTAPAQARLSWAQGLLAAGDAAGASAMANSVEASSLSPDQAQGLAGLRVGIAIRGSDALNTAGRTADAYDQLAPALAQSPNDPALNSALARLYQTADNPRQALAINQQILSRDPTNIDARRGAVAAAIQLGNYALASSFVNENITESPNDPQNWILAADIAQARGLNNEALHDLRQARALRQQQLGYATASGDNQTFTVASNGPVATPLGAISSNPFRNAPTDTTEPTDGGALGGGPLAGTGLVGFTPATAAGTPSGATAADPMIADLDSRITAIDQQVAPQVAGSPTYQQRSGSAGLDQLSTYSVPLEASFSPAGVGRLTITATPTYLSAGQLDTSVASAQQFGTAVFGGPYPSSQSATGVGLNGAYTDGWFTGDVGTTPLGFRLTNVVGGVEIAPQLNSQTILRLTAERRAVTDSELSYAGEEDPRTGIVSGGVVRSRVHGQIEFSPGLASFYAGGGYDWLNGSNVQSNSETELGAGGSYAVYKIPTDEVRVGLNLVYFGYQRNQDHFTQGYGGYFSPQSYVAALIPVSWSATRGPYDYTIGGSIGVQNFNADGEDVFPTSQALQSQVTALAASDTSIQSSYASQSKSGVIGGLNAKFEYHISPQLVVGGTAAYQKSADWNETDVMGFARYTFATNE